MVEKQHETSGFHVHHEIENFKMKFDVIIEKDEDGWFIAEVPALHGCHTQGKTKKEVLENIKEAIELCLEVQAENSKNS